MQIWRSSLYLIGLVGLCLISAPDSGAEEPQPSDKGAIVEGAGFTLYDMESIKGSDVERVERDPVCDRSKRPKIHKVEPDEAKPGQKVDDQGRKLRNEGMLPRRRLQRGRTGEDRLQVRQR